MKIDEFIEIHKKKIIVIAGIVAGLLFLVVGGIFFFVNGREKDNLSEEQEVVVQEVKDMAEVYQDEAVLVLQGVTETVVKQEEFAQEGLAEGLWIEEMYVTVGEAFHEGDRILKFSEESLELAREQLEQVQRDAELAFHAFEIEYEQSKITLRYDKEKAVLAGEQAQAVYDEAVAELSGSVERAKEALTEAKTQIKAYEKIIEGNSSQDPFNVDDYQKLYEENKQILTKKIDEYGFSWDEVVYGNGSAITSEQLLVLQKFYKILEQNLADYEQAQTDYEDAVADAKLNLQTLELSLSALEAELSEAKADYDTKVLAEKKILEQKKADAEHAQTDYVTKLDKLESDYKVLKKAVEDAGENLKNFEKNVGTGYYCATQDGTILWTELGAMQYLGGEQILFAYTTPLEMTVKLTVDQSQIAGIAVGDVAYIKSAKEGSYQATVKEIDLSSQLDNNTDVFYDVTLALSGEIEKLEAGETVTVMFRIGGTANEEAK